MIDLGGLNICFLAGGLGQGGAERQLYYMLKTLRQSGTQLRVLCLTNGDFWEGKIRDLGIPILWVGEDSSKASRLMRIIRVLSEDPPDILQSQHFYTNLYVVAAARILGVREIGAVRGDVFLEMQPMGKTLGTLALKLPQIVAANSRRAIQNAVSMGASESRFHFLSNVVDTEKFNPNTRGVQGPVRFLAVGNLREVKRYDRLLRILAQVQKKMPECFKVSIVGNGPLRVTLEQQAQELGLFPDVLEFKGTVSDVAPLYRTSDVFLITSDREGTPNVILEAMASGLPIVATNVGGIPDIVQQGTTGYLADPDDEAGLIEALNRLIRKPALRAQIGERARTYVTAHHALDRLPDYLRALYAKVLGGGQPGMA